MRELVPNGAVRTFHKNMVVINEGDLSDSLYVILSGRVKVFMSNEEGKVFVLNTIEQGDYFGEIVLDGGPRTASVVTQEESRFFIIPRAEVEGLIERDTAFARDLISRLIRRIRSFADSVRSLALKDVYGRLARFIEENAVAAESGHIIPARLTQQDIAERIGASREMVSRIMTDLTTGGYISVENKQISIHKKLPSNW